MSEAVSDSVTMLIGGFERGGMPPPNSSRRGRLVPLEYIQENLLAAGDPPQCLLAALP